MGYGAHMLVVNSDNQPHKITVNNIDNMSNGTNPDYWNNVTLQPFSAAPETGFKYLESSGISTSSFDLIIDGKVTIPFREEGNYYLDADSLPSWVAVAIDNNNSGSPEGNQAVITVTILNQNAANWMGDVNTQTGGKFFQQTFSQICLPGSHDTGMSVLTESTTFSTAGNTQTQVLNMGQQLNAGVRYFDIRPAFWDIDSWNKNGLLYTGHFSDSTDGQGSLGQDMISLLQQVASFVDANKNEVVILKFSHYASQDTTGFGTHQMNGDPQIAGSGLIPNVKQYLGNNIYTNNNADINIGELKLGDVIQSGKRVICIFDSYSGGNIKDTANGLFELASLSYSQDGTPIKSDTGNYFLFDNYSDTDEYSSLLWSGHTSPLDWSEALGQITPYWVNWESKFGNAGNIFLFSYTLTLIGVDNANPEGPTILENAQFVNPFLLGNIANNYSLFKLKAIPNILYVDAVGLIPQKDNRFAMPTMALNTIAPVNETIYTNMLYLNSI